MLWFYISSYSLFSSVLQCLTRYHTLRCMERISLDWFRGNVTGNQTISNGKKKKHVQKTTGFRLSFPLNQSNAYMGVSTNGGTPSHHPFIDGIFPYKPSSYGGSPMTMESLIYDVVPWIRTIVFQGSSHSG